MTKFQASNILFWLGVGLCIFGICLLFYNNTLECKNAEIQSLQEQIEMLELMYKEKVKWNIIEIQDDLTGINPTILIESFHHKWITNFKQADKADAIKHAKEQGYKNLIEGAPKPGKYSAFTFPPRGLRGLYGVLEE